MQIRHKGINLYNSHWGKIPYELSAGFIDHWLIVHHICVVAKGVVRKGFVFLLNHLHWGSKRGYIKSS